MPETERQRRAAGAELARRRKGVKKLKKATKARPFDDASLRVLREFTRGPVKKKAKKR